MEVQANSHISHFWGIFSSLVDSNKSLSDAIKQAHLNNSINNKVREVIASGCSIYCSRTFGTLFWNDMK
jgi:hypothetical protein